MKLPPTAFLTLLALAAPFFTALEVSSIWDANEAFYVQTPREMLERSDWIVPTFNSEPRLNKPPLSYWIVAAGYRLGSISLFWERFPMALLAWGCVLLVFAIGKLMFNDLMTALWGAILFASTFRFLILSRRLLIDILLLFFVLLAIALFLLWLRDRRPAYFILSAAAFALGFLSKGPAALLPLGFLLPWLLWSGRFSELRKAPVGAALAVFLPLAASWYVLLAWRVGGAAVVAFFMEENLGRFTHLDYGPQRGYFYYAGVFLGDFYPWSLLFLAALLWWWRRGRYRVHEGDSRSVALALLWIAFYFVLFSLSRNKQEYYILPLYPAAALMVGFYLQSWRPKAGPWIAGAAFLAAAVGLWLIAAQLFPGTSLLWLPLLPAALAAVTLGFRHPVGTGLALAAFFSLSFAIYLEPLERYRPVHALVERIELEMARSESETAAHVGYYRLSSPSLVFYLGRTVHELYSLEEAVRLLSAAAPVYLILEDRDLPELERAMGRSLDVLERRPRLFTTARVFVEGIRSGRPGWEAWTREVLLIVNHSKSAFP